jgi:hypothetical protein
MNNYFSISEFIVDPELDDIPIHVADKIQRYHLPIINPIRHRFGSPIYVSEKSGYRPKQWEIDNGRPGTSQHTFGDNQPLTDEWWGAVDYTCSDLEWLFGQLKKSAYKRVCIYRDKGFIHCDHKGLEKLNFEADKDGTWVRI